MRPDWPLGWLSDRLAYEPRDASLFEAALTHRSASGRNNERLEFLGDAVLNLVAADQLFRLHPDADEGDLSRLRARIVSAEPLAAIGQDLGLGEVLQLGSGELKTGGFRRQSILADALEAVLGAVYLDAGWEVARRLVLTLLVEHIDEAAAGPGGHDYKTRLQELVARRFDGAPTYTLDEAGPDHDKRFFATVHVRGEPRGQGEGTSKKQAEQDAARAAWYALTWHDLDQATGLDLDPKHYRRGEYMRPETPKRDTKRDTKNAAPAPSDGARGHAIAPSHGARPSIYAPSDGAMRAP